MSRGGEGSHWEGCEETHHDCCLRKLREAEAANDMSVCIFCGTTMDKDLDVMLEHAADCEKRPENELMRRIAKLEAARNAATALMLDFWGHAGDTVRLALAATDEDGARANKAEAALAEMRRATDEPTTLTISQLRAILARYDAEVTS